MPVSYGPYVVAYRRLNQNRRLFALLQAVYATNGTLVKYIVERACVETYAPHLVGMLGAHTRRHPGSVTDDILAILRGLHNVRKKTVSELVEAACEAWIRREVVNCEKPPDYGIEDGKVLLRAVGIRELQVNKQALAPGHVTVHEHLDDMLRRMREHPWNMSLTPDPFV